MSYELLLVIALFIVALASRFSRRPSTAMALPQAKEQRVPPMNAWLRPPAGARGLVPPPRATGHSGALHVPSETVMKIRAIPLGRPAQRRSAVRLMIILAPPRAASLASLDAAPKLDAAEPRGAGAGRRR